MKSRKKLKAKILELETALEEMTKQYKQYNSMYNSVSNTKSNLEKEQARVHNILDALDCPLPKTTKGEYSYDNVDNDISTRLTALMGKAAGFTNHKTQATQTTEEH